MIEAQPKLHRITFRRGTVWNARFTPDGNLIYAASWDGRPIDFFAGSASSTESRPFGSAFAKLYAISSSGEMAVLIPPGVRHRAVGLMTIPDVAVPPSDPADERLDRGRDVR